MTKQELEKENQELKKQIIQLRLALKRARSKVNYIERPTQSNW
jgi:ribosomal protein L29